MNALTLIILYCVVISASSLFGGRISSLLRMTHLRTQLLMSFVGGLMLGIAMLHLFPHATEILGSGSRAGAGALAGLTIMFLMIRLFHTHDHGGPATDDSAGKHQDGHVECNHTHPADSARRISWVGLFFGLLLHTLIDGIALSASVIAETQHGAWLGLGGLGTFLAVALHKPLDAFAITSVMSRQNWSETAQLVANVLFSLACPIGAFAFYFGIGHLVSSPNMLGWGLAISAGFFIGIALADLLPEVAFHDHDRGKLTVALLLGIGIAIGVENLPGHRHQHHIESSAEHSDDHHDHSRGGHQH